MCARLFNFTDLFLFSQYLDDLARDNHCYRWGEGWQVDVHQAGFGNEAATFLTVDHEEDGLG